MEKKVIYKSKIAFGWFFHFLFFFILFLNAVMFFYIAQIVFLFIEKLVFNIISIIFFLPLVILDIFLFPILKVVFLNLIKKEEYTIIIYNEGIEINTLFLEWKKIKSISFQTGRLITGNDFLRGFKLSAIQKIYILDKKGKEYSCAIDIDYFSKKDRSKNNLSIIKGILHEQNKIFLLSDWAEKR